MSNKAVMCIVQTRPHAERILAKLQQEGFTANDVSVLLPNKEGTKDFAYEHHTKAPEGAVAGAGAGGVVGGTLGLLAGLGLLAIPGLGPFIAVGPIFAALSGVAAGVTVGGIAGALIGMGVPEIEAKRYEGKVKGGNMLISVHTDSVMEQKRVEGIFAAGNAEDICSTTEASVPRSKQLQPGP